MSRKPHSTGTTATKARVTRPVRKPRPVSSAKVVPDMKPEQSVAPAKPAIKPAAERSIPTKAPETPPVSEAASTTPPEIVPTVDVSPAEFVPQPTRSDPISKGINVMATASPEKIQTVFTDMSDRAKAAFEKSSKLGEEFAELTKGNLEALAESAKIAAKNAEALAQEAADYTKKNFESATAAMKRYGSVKSPVELVQLNGEFAKTSFDSAVAEASKISETVTKMMNEMFQPLSSRYAVASEKLKSTAF